MPRIETWKDGELVDVVESSDDPEALKKIARAEINRKVMEGEILITEAGAAFDVEAAKLEIQAPLPAKGTVGKLP